MTEEIKKPTTISSADWQRYLSGRHYRLWQVLLMLVERRPTETAFDAEIDVPDSPFHAYYRVSIRSLVDPLVDGRRTDDLLYVVRPLFTVDLAINVTDEHFVDLWQFVRFAKHHGWVIPLGMEPGVPAILQRLEARRNQEEEEQRGPKKKHPNDSSESTIVLAWSKLVAVLLVRAYSAKLAPISEPIPIDKHQDMYRLKKQVRADLKELVLMPDAKTVKDRLTLALEEFDDDGSFRLVDEAIDAHAKKIDTALGVNENTPD